MPNENYDETFLKLFNFVDRLHSTAIKTTQKAHVELIESLTHRQGQALFIVASLCMKQPLGVRMSELAQRLHMSLPATSVLVEAMVQKKIFFRSQGVNDRRLVYITLSKQGSENFEKVRTFMQCYILSLMEQLTPKEKKVFVDVINRFYDTLSDE